MKRIESLSNTVSIWYNLQNGVETWTVQYADDFENFDTFDAANDRAQALADPDEVWIKPADNEYDDLLVEPDYSSDEVKCILKPRKGLWPDPT